MIFACQREDLDGSRPGRTAGGGQPRPMGLVASSAVRELREGGLDRKGGERSFDNGFAMIRGPHTQISIRAILSKLNGKKQH